MLVLGGGNGSLVYSETLIPSSLAALFITLSPFWYSGLEAIIPGGEKLTGAVLAGIVTGFLAWRCSLCPTCLKKG
jgi:drug/metabolite transporter (DMT)-like permease